MIEKDLLVEAEGLLDRRALREALDAFSSAEEKGGDADRCAAGRWMAYMLSGDFSSAWMESDAIRKRGGPDPHRLWNGEDICGKQVIVRCLHGFGDTIQLLRYAPLLATFAKKVVFEVPPKLLEIAPYCEGVDEVITWGELAPKEQPTWEVAVEVTQLPYLFRTQLADLPIQTNYLKLPASFVTAPSEPGGTIRVGIVWTAGEWNSARSLPFRLVECLMREVECEFWNLQGGFARQEWLTLPRHPRLQEASACADSILNLAKLIAELDLIITVDTLAAHLAGAMGKEAWVLLQRAADWRWMTDRDDSPWYPSLTLFRQPVENDWDGLMCEVTKKLQSRAASARGSERAA